MNEPPLLSAQQLFDLLTSGGEGKCGVQVYSDINKFACNEWCDTITYSLEEELYRDLLLVAGHNLSTMRLDLSLSEEGDLLTTNVPAALFTVYSQVEGYFAADKHELLDHLLAFLRRRKLAALMG